ncbi:iron ABC transporter permease [Acidaminobacter sp. JC074]|uniref:FecCD family ABC transporter permease n=1 Tax=Acidaminobacter sp. JC074 TaxID=2530199 RepID=UPI001F0F4B22|nr:iron ABC transporter permease [Acidaminobacter sp. JC074]
MNKISYGLLITVLLVAVVLTAIFSITIGTVDIPIEDVIDTIANRMSQSYSPSVLDDVIFLIRMPRIFLAIMVGITLAVVGVVMQAIVKNPLADPYILGISSGASLGATLAILLGIGAIFGGNFVGVMAFLGAFSVSIGVMMISNINGKSNSIRLLLAGMALSAVCSSLSSLIIYLAHDKDGIQSITYWLMGSLAGAKWSQLMWMFPVIIIGFIFFMTQYRTLNLMLLGDDVAITLGKQLDHSRTLYLVITSLMMGLVVYSSGMIGFVGLIIPHICRMILGTDHKKLIPASALLGAVFILWADIFSRTILPHSELPIGILISAIGAPCFVWLLIKRNYGFGGHS